MPETTNEKLRLLGVLRVSTAAQADDDRYGLPAQEANVRHWVGTHGHDLVDLVPEAITGEAGADPINGVQLDQRPELADVLVRVESGEAHGLVVPSLQRLARTLTVQEAILAYVWSLGGRMFAADTGEVLVDDPDDPMRTAMRQMSGVFNQLDKSLLLKRLRDGRKAKATQGRYAYGAPPFGHRADRKELVPDPDEQAVITRVTTWHRAGDSYATIAARLNAEAVPTKRRGRWHPTSVARLLDPAYRDRNAAQGARRRRPPTRRPA